MDAMLIDGDRAHFEVTFNHDEHAEREGGERACMTCHHMNSRLKTSTPCSECHRDVYLETYIFNHQNHVTKFGGDEGCETCHKRSTPPAAKVLALENEPLENEALCDRCHADNRARETFVELSKTTRVNYAVSYKDAMHNLCIRCHESRRAEVNKPNLAICTTCHPPLPGERMSPAVDIVLEE
jgi:predicted CXXCH cytochrome family protein